MRGPRDPWHVQRLPGLQYPGAPKSELRSRTAWHGRARVRRLVEYLGDIGEDTDL